MYKTVTFWYVNLTDLLLNMHMYENTHTDILVKVVGMLHYSISHTPLPPPTTLRLAIVSSVAPKERATLSMEQVRPVQEVMDHRLGGHRGEERDGILLIITIKGLVATRGGVMVLVVEVKVHGGQVTSGQVRIMSEVLGEVKVVCVSSILNDDVTSYVSNSHITAVTSVM